MSAIVIANAAADVAAPIRASNGSREGRRLFARLDLLAFVVGSMVMLAACAPPDDVLVSPDGGRDAPAGAAPTYIKDVQPIFAAKCSPCHAGQQLGGHDVATTYADALKPIASFDSEGCWNDADSSTFTMPKKVGECALVLITSGRMPQGAGCANEMPLMPASCLSSDQKAIIAAWVAAGLPR